MGRFSGTNGSVSYTCECGKSGPRPLAQLHKAGKCSGCKTPIPAPASPISVDTKTFDKLLKMSKVPVFVDFWASWCGPCKQVAPEVARVAENVAGETLVLKVDTEANPTLSQRYNVRSIPMFMVFKRGKPVDQRAGAISAGEMQAWLRTSLAG